MRVSLRHAGLGVQEMATYLDVTRGADDRVAPSKQTMRLWSLRCGVPLEWLETGKAPTLPSGPSGLYTSRRDELAARRTARSAVEEVAA